MLKFLEREFHSAERQRHQDFRRAHGILYCVDVSLKKSVLEKEIESWKNEMDTYGPSAKVILVGLL